MTSEITITGSISTGITKTVTIYTAKVEEEFGKKLTQVPKPVTKAKRGTQEPQTRILDLLLVTHSFTINGHITAQTINGESKTATEARNYLRNMITHGGTLTLNYDGTNYEGNVTKVRITEVAIDEPATLPSDAVKYDVMFQFLVGVDI